MVGQCGKIAALVLRCSKNSYKQAKVYVIGSHMSICNFMVHYYFFVHVWKEYHGFILRQLPVKANRTIVLLDLH